MTSLEQTSALDDAGLVPASWTGFARSDLQAAGEAWRARATQERRSAAVFATILSGLAALDVPLSVLAAVARIVADEVRHTAICRRLAAELGADVPDDDLGAAERRLRPPQTGLTESAMSLRASGPQTRRGRRPRNARLGGAGIAATAEARRGLLRHP